MLLLALAVLTATAVARGAEYDEQYTLFLTAGVARPAWPATAFPAGMVWVLQSGHASLAGIARDLRATDVHPPLYFWAVARWRRLMGSGLLTARVFSVLCDVAALAAVGVIACRTGPPPALAMLLTLGCYGFAYTGAIARGFALPQALTLWGVVALLSPRRRGFVGGVLLGAAMFANYLAAFVAAATVAARVATGRTADPRWVDTAAPGRQRGAACSPGFLQGVAADSSGGTETRLPASCLPGLPLLISTLTGLLPFLLANLWFFLAQRDSRTGQFPPFSLLAALPRLARYAAANLFGGLPLYAPAPARAAIAAAVALLALVGAALIAARWRHIAVTASARRLLLAAALAPHVGLLALSAIFHDTYVELRYLAFATPFAALLLAGAIASLPPLARRTAIAVVLSVQAASLAGLMVRPETMQPARATAAAAARLAGGGIVLVPRGNDGVGIVGAFAIESPASQRLMVVSGDETPARILARLGTTRRVVLALLAQDNASRATLPAMRAALDNPCWRRLGDGFNVLAFDRVCDEDMPWSSSTVSR
ncbi:MAG TPA: glycosyltransferase family 39 protein [Acetobacteraceae bacterium]|nr:glycosyltransferase family 39 protein [Acetobacteraceae bacterium]